MRNLSLLLLAMVLSFTGLRAQTSCPDLNKYPEYKNTGGTSSFSLRMGYEEKAAQTYFYSSQGSISQVRVYGTVTSGLILPMVVTVYNVDANGRPTTAIKSVNTTWTIIDNVLAYKDISMGGVTVTSNFAVGIAFASSATSNARFELWYNGDGDGRGEDLASLAGSSTGNNWASAKKSFSRDGDFFIMPRMTNFITADFSMENCAGLNEEISFTNKTVMSTDSMFNRIMLNNYKGTYHLYKWNFGDGTSESFSTNPKHTYANAGHYTVTLTSTIDGWNNTCSDVKKIDISVGLGVSIKNVVSPLCYGNKTASVTVEGYGGAKPYKYSLDGHEWTTSGSFNNLSAGDHFMYIIDSLGCIQLKTFEITQPSPISVSSVNTTSASCGQSNGAILIKATGGTGTLKYSLNGDNGWQTSGYFTNLKSGSYTIHIKDSFTCSITYIVGVKDAAGPDARLISFNNISCAGGNDGSITVGSTGGTGTVQYSIDGTNYFTSGTFGGLMAGTYVVTVKDASGCIDYVRVTLTVPTPITFNTTTVATSCKGSKDGKINVLNTIGGTGTFRYSINGTNYQTSNTFSGLYAGTYTVYAKDAAGCLKTGTAVVNEPAVLTASISSVNLTCYQSGNGSISVSGSGGTSPYYYSIDDENYQPVGVFTNLNAGEYIVFVKDAHNCSYAASVTITQPTEIQAVITTTNSTCGNNNGKILVVASGGSGAGYTYSINGTTFTSNNTFSNLVDSTYYIIVKDNTGCMNGFTAVVVNSDGPQITSISHTNNTCNGGNDGTITVNTTSGGTGTLYYSIDGFNWQTSTLFTHLIAGSYIVRVRDGVGCTGNTKITITEPAQIVITATVNNVLCNGGNSGKITVNAAGGAGTMAYSVDGIHFQSSNIFTGLVSDNYTIYVRDAGNCQATKTVTITQPEKLELLASATSDVTCHGDKNGEIYILGKGGTGSLSYSVDGTNYNTTGIFRNLNGGRYLTYIKDANGCILTQYVTVVEPELLTVSANVSDVSCAGGSNGVINLTVNGGTAPYNFIWNNQRFTEDQFNLKAGSYSVLIRDANGCSVSKTYTVTQPEQALIVNAVVKNASTSVSSDGALDVTVTGGTPPYQYHWSTNSNTEDLTNLHAGSYTINVSDFRGCEITITFTVGIATAIQGSEKTEHKVSVYPNPATHILNVKVEGVTLDRIDIINALGQTVATQIVNNASAVINVEDLSAGVYILQYKIDGVPGYQRIKIVR